MGDPVEPKGGLVEVAQDEKISVHRDVVSTRCKTNLNFHGPKEVDVIKDSTE